jgi:tRNA-specific 2-thiouridylase
MSFPLPIPAPLREAARPGTGVLVALSGGVDSSVALALLDHLGCEIHAVTFKNFCYGDEGDSAGRSCCSLEAIEEARRVAERFGARHWVADVSEGFRSYVIDPFVAEYSDGRTPNPCLACNALVRFPALLQRAQQLDLERVATGHYARVEPLVGGGCLRRGLDPEKDQAYFLYRLGRELLPRILFPLGWYRKSEVREAARILALPTADRRESQEVCFVPGGDRSFLFPRDPGLETGEIVDREGKVLGEHGGLIHYTVGQRRGLGIAAPEALYVLALDQERNRLVVGPRRELAVRRVICDGFVAMVADFPGTGPPSGVEGPWLARIRYRHAGTPVAAWSREDGNLSVVLARPASGVAPGQSLVLYRDDLVLGGGRIVATAA